MQLGKALDTDPQLRKMVADTGTEVLSLSPPEVTARIGAEQKVWKEVIDRLNLVGVAARNRHERYAQLIWANRAGYS